VPLAARAMAGKKHPGELMKLRFSAKARQFAADM
jgi:hypothetical protein